MGNCSEEDPRAKPGNREKEPREYSHENAAAAWEHTTERNCASFRVEERTGRRDEGERQVGVVSKVWYPWAVFPKTSKGCHYTCNEKSLQKTGMSEKGGGGGGRIFLIRLFSSEFPSPKPQCAYMDTEDLVRSFPESNNVVGEITIRNIRGFSFGRSGFMRKFCGARAEDSALHVKKF